jgi:hypothetical protein
MELMFKIYPLRDFLLIASARSIGDKKGGYRAVMVQIFPQMLRFGMSLIWQKKAWTRWVQPLVALHAIVQREGGPTVWLHHSLGGGDSTSSFGGKDARLGLVAGSIPFPGRTLDVR